MQWPTQMARVTTKWPTKMARVMTKWPTKMACDKKMANKNGLSDNTIAGPFRLLPDWLASLCNHWPKETDKQQQINSVNYWSYKHCVHELKRQSELKNALSLSTALGVAFYRKSFILPPCAHGSILWKWSPLYCLFESGVNVFARLLVLLLVLWQACLSCSQWFCVCVCVCVCVWHCWWALF